MALLSAASLDLLAQGEVITPLSARPVPEALRTMRKANGLNEYFIYQYAPQQIPTSMTFRPTARASVGRRVVTRT